MQSNFYSNNKIYIGTAAVMSAVFLWGIDAILWRPYLNTLPVALVVFVDYSLGFIILSPFIILSWHRIKYMTTKDWMSVLLISLFGGLLGTIMLTKAFFMAVNSEVTFTEIIMIQKLQPVFTLFFAAIILKERLNYKFYISAFVAIAASYFLAFNFTSFNIADNLFTHKAPWYALLAALFYGSATVFGKRLLNHLDFKAVAALRLGVTAILAFLLILITDDLWQMSNINSVQWVIFVKMILSTGVAATLFYYFGLKRLTASTTAIIELFWPLFAILLDYIINKRTLNITQIISIVLLLVSTYYITKFGKPQAFKFKANVISGLSTGRIVGLATIHLDKVSLDIEHGVYKVMAYINDNKYIGLLHFGYRETLKLGPTIELYLTDFVGNLYGVSLDVQILNKIRDIKKYKHVSELREQVQQDLEML